MSAFDPAHELTRLQESHRRLLDTLAGLNDDVARKDSLLPGWTIGHVLTHIARNADSVVRRLDGAARDEVVDQYPGGEAGRSAEIEQGAGRGAAELVDDVRTTAEAVESAAARMPEDAWDRVTRSVSGNLSPSWAVLAGRTREVEIHHVDLGLGYRPQDWPADFVQEQLLEVLPGLAERCDPAALLAWATGRGPAPELGPWR